MTNVCLCRLLVVLAWALAIAGCASSGTSPMKQPDLTESQWQVAELEGEPVAEDLEITLQFPAEGGVAGSGGCNRFFGPVTLEQNSIRFGMIGSTMRACDPTAMQVEIEYLRTLGRVQTWEIVKDTLRLSDEQGEPIVVLEPLE